LFPFMMLGLMTEGMIPVLCICESEFIPGRSALSGDSGVSRGAVRGTGGLCAYNCIGALREAMRAGCSRGEARQPREIVRRQGLSGLAKIWRRILEQSRGPGRRGSERW
jgi:hypothetical protein